MRGPTSIRHGWVLACLGLAVTAGELAAQDLHPSRRLSPVGIAKTHVGDTYIKVTYGRPYLRGRAIFGMAGAEETYLVPYGQVWRTGANEATELTTTGPVTIAGEPLDAGTYSVFTVPGAESWRLHFSPQLGLDGMGMLSEDGQFTPDVYDASKDVLVVDVPASTTEEEVDPFTISFVPDGPGTLMVLAWERTEVRVPIRTR